MSGILADPKKQIREEGKLFQKDFFDNDDGPYG
jgi:hypothetical protein